MFLSGFLQTAHGEEGLSLSKARLEPRSEQQHPMLLSVHPFETRLRQAQPLLRVSGSFSLIGTPR